MKLVVPLLALLAAAPDNADQSLAPWFQSLRQPGSNGSCCDIADCRPALDVKIQDGAYWVRDPEGSAMLRVPPAHVLARGDNPTGQFIVCIFHGQVLCFVRQPGM